MLVGIVKRIETEVLARQRPIVFSEALHSIDDGRIALQTHAFTQAIFKTPATERPLSGFGVSLSTSDASRHDSKHAASAFVHLPVAEDGATRFPLFLEFAHTSRPSTRWRKDASKLIGGREEKTFERLRTRRETTNQRGVARGIKKSPRGHEFPGCQFAAISNIVSPSRTVNGCW